MNTYIIKKINTPASPESFESANTLTVNYSPWEAHTTPYNTRVQLLYSDEALYLHFKTDEKHPTAKTNKRNGDIYLDSCMEFFFRPSENDPRYFNFEINPVTALYTGFGASRHESKKITPDKDMFNIKSIVTKDGWELYYEIPFSFLREYVEVTNNMYANFYKCGDPNVLDHYACWNEIHLPDPDFHCSEFFGKLTFEEGAPAK